MSASAAKRGACWATSGCSGEVRFYLNGWACVAHSPAAMNGRTVPTPDPKRTLRGLIEEAGGRYDRTFTPETSTAIDQQAVASGKRRASDAAFRLARQESE